MIRNSFGYRDEDGTGEMPDKAIFEAFVTSEAEQPYRTQILYHSDGENMEIGLCTYDEVEIIGMCCTIGKAELIIDSIAAPQYTADYGNKLLAELEIQARCRGVKNIVGFFILPSKFAEAIPLLFEGNKYRIEPVGEFQMRVAKELETLTMSN